MNTEKFNNLVKKAYSDWTEADHDLGYKVTYSTYEAMDYDNMKSDNPDDWSYKVYQAKYQPKGYWSSSIITVEASREGVNFSRSSGGDIGDVDGLEQMTHFTRAMKEASRFASHTKKQIERGNK